MLYLEADHLGAVRAARNSIGQVVWRWESDAFGATLPNEDPDGNRQKTTVNLRFPGQIADSPAPALYNWHRYYDPTSGRYVSSDPIGVAGGLNTYAYVENNPLRWIDPTGLYTEIIIWQPVTWGTSSFGHVSANVNGTNYSWGPGGWDMKFPNASDYGTHQQGFRSGAGVILTLTPDQPA